MMAPSQSTTSANGNNGSGDSANAATGTRKIKSPIQEYLTNSKSLYSCIYCRTHLADHDELVSRSFQGNHGRAYLFNSVVNVQCGPAVQRELNTGSHAVADIYCANCHTTLGWKYEKAYVDTQKYKEGKYIIELAHVVRENRHLEFDKSELFLKLSKSDESRSTKRLQDTTNSRHRDKCSSESGNTKNRPSNSSSSVIEPTKEATNGDLGGSSYRSSGYNYEEVDDDDDDDEELMFPFYDDMCGSRSSYPGNLSLNQHNRMRRSLHIESTPYDWKYATTTTNTSSSSFAANPASQSNAEATCYKPEFNQLSQAPKLTSATSTTTAVVTTTAKHSHSGGSSLADSGLSSDLSSPSTSSSSSNASPEQRQKSYHSDGGGRNDNNNLTDGGEYKLLPTDSKDTSEHYVRETDNDETQFKFEADGSTDPPAAANDVRATLGQLQQCDQLDSRTSSVNCNLEHKLRPTEVVAANSIDDLGSNSSSNSSSGNRNASEIEHDCARGDQVPSSSINLNPSNDTNSSNSVCIEDEEFYDCFTDHEVSTL